MKKKNNRRLTALAIPLLCFATYAPSAFAASLLVKVRQVNPDGIVQQVDCGTQLKCLVPVSIVTRQGEKQTLTTHILRFPDNVLFEFETPKGFLYARESGTSEPHAIYVTLWHGSVAKDKLSVNDVALFLPFARRGESGRMRTSVEAQVADLQITTEVKP